MVARRLTKNQKNEILEGYRLGKSLQNLAKIYECSPNTVTRTVRNLISKQEYLELKESRSREFQSKREKSFLQNRSSLEKISDLKDSNIDNHQINMSASISSNQESCTSSADKEDSFGIDLVVSNCLALDDASDFNNQIDEEAFDNEENDFESAKNEDLSAFEEVVPLTSTFGFESEEQGVSCQPLDNDSLPETVYMLVDKKVELEFKAISELVDWSFLPEAEKDRNAILLFSNQRAAKRNCNRNQRVIKVPNTDIFRLSSRYLISQGITRLIIEDSLIALDN